jgi:hypothetical protein
MDTLPSIALAVVKKSSIATMSCIQLTETASTDCRCSVDLSIRSFSLSELDNFQPKGIPIHPYDLYEVMMKAQSPFECIESEVSPAPEDEADYLRNRDLGKFGSTVILNGVEYFQTTSVVPKTKLIA